jgi:hypothetical protein
MYIHSKATDLFSSTKEAMEFVEDYDLDVAKATLLQQTQRHAEAAEVHIVEGRSVEGIRIFLEHLADENCARRGVICVIQALWKHLSFGVLPAVARSDTVLDQWIELATRLTSTRHCDEVRALHAYRDSLADCRSPDIYVPSNPLPGFKTAATVSLEILSGGQ